MKTIYVVLIILLIIIGIITISILSYNFIFNKSDFKQIVQNSLRQNIYHKNYNSKIGKLPSCFLTRHVELGERQVADIYTRSDACVLEFGGGSGAVSTIVQRNLDKPSDHVVVQPNDGEDSETPFYGGTQSLYKNKLSCKSKYHIIDHVLSKGEGEKLLKLVSKPFDTLVVDCEGCLTGEYDKNPELFTNIKMIQVERDDNVKNPEKGKYQKLFKKLQFHKTHIGVGCDGTCVTEVWERT